MIHSDKVFEVINEIADANGTYYKMQLLGFANMDKYLVAAYDPYTRYYITKVKPGKGTAEFSDITWTILDQLSSRELSGHAAQMIVDTHTSGLTARSSEIFKRIINKDLRMGLGAKSINKAFPGLIPTHNVMLAKLFDAKRLKFPCYGSPKIDGVRAKFRNGVFYSRNGHPYVGLEHLENQLQGMTEELDGELLAAGVSFQEGSGLIRSDNPTPSAVFHLIELPTIKAPFVERLSMMEDLQEVHKGGIFAIQHKILQDEDDVMHYYKASREAGYEGAVIKPIDYEYVGTRSYNWMKMKNVDTADLIVTGVYEGKGKYEGQLGGVIVDFNGQPNKVGGGWNDGQREFFWHYPQSIIGKCIEVLYMEKTNDGNMRHSRFERFREDKDND